MKQKCLGRGSKRKIKVFGNGPMREEEKMSACRQAALEYLRQVTD